jgi:plasmid replication initiation protein
MLNILSDTKKSIVETMTIRMLPNEALQYLHDCGRKISKRSYLRLKAKLEAMNFQRLMHTTKWFTDQHLQRIDKLELVGYLMWKL